ncbi:MAG: hypothetical protein ACFFC7_24525 [Candidatus Hermodarchaeota archaeon]
MTTLKNDVLPKGIVFGVCPNCYEKVPLVDFNPDYGAGGACKCGLYVTVKKGQIPQFDKVVEFAKMKPPDQIKKLIELGILHMEHNNLKQSRTLFSEALRLSRINSEPSLKEIAEGYLNRLDIKT